jgi:hypothetical protein
LDATAIQSSARESVVLILEDGARVRVPVLGMSAQSVDASIPAFSRNHDGNYYYGNAQVCVVIDSQQTCSPEILSIAQPLPSGQPVGTALLAFLQAAAAKSLNALPAGTDPAVAASIAARQTALISNLQQLIESANAGNPQNIYVKGANGTTVALLMDLPAIQKLEALLTANSPPGSASTSSAATAAMSALRDAEARRQLLMPSTSATDSSCSPTESYLLAAKADYNAELAAQQVISWAGLIPFATALAEGCAAGLAGGPAGCVVGMVVTASEEAAVASVAWEIASVLNEGNCG